LSLFTSQAAVAIRNARLYEEARRRAERLAVVNRIAKAASAILHLDDLVETVYQEVVPVFQADAFFIALYDKEANELDFCIQVDEGVYEPPRRVPLGVGLASVVVTEKRPLIIREEQEYERLQVPRNLFGTMKPPISWLGVPMLAGEQVLGIINVQAYCPHVWNEEDEQLLFTIADQIAVAIENARLYEAVQQELAERKRAEEALQEAYESVERLVEERTVELRQETAERKRLEIEQEQLKEEIIQAQRRALL
jgi:GAF domain-containing protein